MMEFEKDIQLKRHPDAGLAQARTALQIVEQIYRKSGFDFDSAPAKP
jgi:exonuclease VII small subunit